MRRIVCGFAFLALSGCSMHAPESVQPKACYEVTRLEQQALLARNAAVVAGAQAGALRVMRSTSMNPTDKRHEELEFRRSGAHAQERAAEHGGRAAWLSARARSVAAELRADGIRCDR